jgi:hypothetical protein
VEDRLGASFQLSFKVGQKPKLKIRKKSDFGAFHSPKVRGKKGNNRQIHILGFHCVAKKIEG